jgi:dTDP-4-amino-4,6-dideoxygalactose transaminase
VEVPFNRPHLVGRELEMIAEAVREHGHLSGAGPFSARCTEWLEQRTGARRALITSSCTAALEMAAILADLGPGDEVLMPSFTFTSTANSVVLRGATPVFVDVREDTLNLDESLLADACTERTRAIVPVHYAGVGCEMEAITDLARERGLIVIEDAAQGLGSSKGGRPLGSIGQLGAISFHETKNVISGEGGALLVNDPDLVERAEVIYEKGTNRVAFHRGETDKYTWVDIGSSFLASELTAAFLWAQLQEADRITERRLEIWDRYHRGFESLEAEGKLRRPIVPDDGHNGHIYYLLLPDRAARDGLIADLGEAGIATVFHYVPLHSSPAGRRYGRAAGELPITDSAGERLVRLPLWVGLSDEQVDAVIDATERALA